MVLKALPRASQGMIPQAVLVQDGNPCSRIPSYVSSSACKNVGQGKGEGQVPSQVDMTLVGAAVSS